MSTQSEAQPAGTLRPHQVIEACGVRPDHVCEQRIILGRLGNPKAVHAQEAAVQPADGSATVAQEFLEEMLVDDPQVGALDEGRGKSREARQLLHDVQTFLDRKLVSFH